MGRNEKLLDRISKKPKDFTYDELRRLLTGLQGQDVLLQDTRLPNGRREEGI